MMKYSLFRVIGVAFFSLSLAGCLFAQASPLVGDWVGGTDLFKNPVFVHVRFIAPDKGLANIQPWRVSNRELSVVQMNSATVRFEFPSSTGTPYVAEGQMENGIIKGTMSRGESKGSFHLIRVADTDRKLYDKYVGAYAFTDLKTGKEKISLITYGALGHLRWVDLESGQTTALFPVSGMKFFFGFSVVQQSSPDVFTWSFNKDKDGKVSSLVRLPGQPDQTGRPAELYKQEQVTLRNGTVQLAATLMTPPGKGPHPAVVYIPGSGGDYTSRDSALYREYDLLLRGGVAVLIYDKRGTGASTGDWKLSSFEDLGRDALAGVRYLKSRADINAKKIGVWGFSQGATIAPYAASVSKDVAFVIMMSGGAISAAEAEKNEQIAYMRAAKLSDAEISEALEFIKLQFDSLKSEEGWKKFQAAIPAARGKKWFGNTWGGLAADHWLWAWWRLVINHEPARVLEKVNQPVLAFWGAGDKLTTPEAIEEMAARTEQSLKKGGNKDVTIKIFPEVGHDLTINGTNSEKVAPGFNETLTSWVLRVSKK